MPRPGPKRALDAMVAFIVLGTIATMGVRLGSVWNLVRERPERLVAEVARSVTARLAAPAPSAPERPPEPPARPVTRRSGVDIIALAASERGAVVLATVSPAGDSLAPGAPIDRDSAARAFDRERVARAVAAAASVAALDSLAERLRADYPHDPQLAPEGRVGKLLDARRAQLVAR